MGALSATHVRAALKHGFCESEIFKQTIDTINELKVNVLVCTGLSGILFASKLQCFVNVGIAYIRKEDDVSTHSYREIECTEDCADLDDIRWMFVDDLIESGRTMERVLDMFTDPNVNELLRNGRSCVFVGAAMYDEECIYDGDDYTNEIEAYTGVRATEKAEKAKLLPEEYVMLSRKDFLRCASTYYDKYVDNGSYTLCLQRGTSKYNADIITLTHRAFMWNVDQGDL